MSFQNSLKKGFTNPEKHDIIDSERRTLQEKGEMMVLEILLIAGLTSGFFTLLILAILRAGKQADEERRWALWRQEEEDSSEE